MPLRHISSSLACFLLVAISTLVSTNTKAQDSDVDPLLTVAESSEFSATATGMEVQQFLSRLVQNWDAPVQLHTLGTTVDGRTIQAVIVEPTDSDPKSLALNVLVLGGIHPGECDGKESLLAYLRDLSRDSDPQWRANLRLIFVPNFNADGDARRGREHRPGQAGPVAGMGIRENALGLDLNRDFIKLESPEVRNLVAAFNQFDVDVLIDLHTTNGSLHRYQLTYDIPHHPAASPKLDQYLRADLLPAVTEQMLEKGFNTFYYGNFDRQHERWESYGHQPRYSTEYMGLRGKIGILVESYSYASYQTRFLANYAFVDEVLHKLAQDVATIKTDIAQFAAATQPGLSVPVAGELVQTQQNVTVLGYKKPDGSPPTGPYNDRSAAEHTAFDYSVQLWNTAKPSQSVKLPTAYAIAPEFAWAISRLQQHGVSVGRLTDTMACEMETAEITKLTSDSIFQGHAFRKLEVLWKPEKSSLPAGTYIIQANRLSANLLEPNSEESLATWNFFDPYLSSGGSYPVQRLVTPILESGKVVAVNQIEPGEVVTVDNIFQPGGSFLDAGPKLVNEAPSWLSSTDTAEFVQVVNGQLVAIEAETGSQRRLSQIRQLESKLNELEAFNPTQSKNAATSHNFWRTGSNFALINHQNDLYFYDQAKQIVRQLTHSPDLPEELAELSPTGSAVVFVRENNLWVVDCETTELRQLTHNGSTELLNGILDWVYQEELYGRGNFKAFWWSPDGRRIAYLQLDQSSVPEYKVSDSVSVAQSLEATRYPKAGQPIPVVRVFTQEVQQGGAASEVNLSQYPDSDRIVGRVTWSPKGDLWLQVFNRVQNQQDLIKVDNESGALKPVLRERSTGWLEIRGVPTFLSSGDVLWLSDLPAGRTHLYRVNAETGKTIALTSGDWDVTDLISVSADERYAFLSGNPGSPIETHLIQVDLQSASWKKVTSAPGTHRATVDPSGTYFIDSFSNLSTPPITSLHAIDGSLIRVLSANPSDRYQYLATKSPQLTTITTRDGLELQAMVMLPYDSQTSQLQDAQVDSVAVAPKKLPVLFHVYAGPQAPTVSNAWPVSRNYWWHQALCAQGYAVVLVDNRSSRGRGVADTWTIRGDLGRVELQDVEDAVGWIQQQPWADAERIGIWGWSYGGYFTAYAMTHSQLFKAGISGAPVTDWRNYDAIYTERYMDLPQQNAAGYDSSSVVKAAGNLHGTLLLIHGERDDNVHLSNSIQFVNALQDAGKQFQFMIYPKNRHGIVEPSKRFHMYRMMTDFLNRNLKE